MEQRADSTTPLRAAAGRSPWEGAAPNPGRGDDARPDVLERLRTTEAALEDARRQLDAIHNALLHTERLAALGTLSATLAHEFNNLLTPVLSYAQIALRSLESPEPDLELVKKALRRCYSSGDKASRIGSAILNLARVPRGEPEACDVADAVSEALAAMGREPHKDGIELRMEVPSGLRVALEPIQLEQVLLNLLLNARHALLATGRRRGGLLEIHARRQGGRIHLCVRDTGCGIPADRLARIFEPFYTERRNTDSGTGLGLTLCKQIVERHGGSITARSEVGSGTSIEVLLPAA